MIDEYFLKNISSTFSNHRDPSSLVVFLLYSQQEVYQFYCNLIVGLVFSTCVTEALGSVINGKESDHYLTLVQYIAWIHIECIVSYFETSK